MEGSNVGVYTTENNDLASLVGVLKYVHTEVLAEHSISPNDRLTRKYSIDVISKSRFRVRNPASLLSPTSGMVANVDFGGYVTYDNGVATNNAQLSHIRTYGGYVGVQEQRDVRFAYSEPYFWFSVNGFCPNLDWAHKGSLASPNPSCVRGDDGWLVAGGLCQGTDVPTGEANCTYTYGNASVVELDALAGLRDQDCGGRTCADWADFRRNCTNTSYRRAFDAQSGAVVAFPYCVEYDLSPFCEADCSAPACLAVPEAERELGLPFWRGRCSAQRNAWRAERLAAAFGLLDAAADGHLSGAVPAATAAAPCAYPGGMCNPAPASGGMYCSRAWAGVCQPCWVPGTRLTYPDSNQPLCPYDVLEATDYRQLAAGPPECASTHPSDLCCIYRSPSTCSPPPSTPLASLPLDDDGYALAAARRNTTEMVAFLTRVAAEKLGGIVSNPVGFEELAYWEWGVGPKKGRTLQAVEAAMAPYLALPTSTVTTTSTATTTATPIITATSTTSVEVPGAGTTTNGDLPTSRSAPRKGLITIAHALVAVLAVVVVH